MPMSQAAAYEPGDVVGVKCKHGGNVYNFAPCDDLLFEDCLWSSTGSWLGQNPSGWRREQSDLEDGKRV